jgi:uncharacterized protein (TIGR03086 family)
MGLFYRRGGRLASTYRAAMDALEALSRSEVEILTRVDQLTDEHWGMPTVCGEWTVEDLVCHLVSGARVAVVGLSGAPKERVIESVEWPIEGDLVAALRAAFAEQTDAMRRPGALEMTVHYPTIDMPGEQLLGFRVVDLTMHAWDLSRSLGFDERLDAELVEWTWEWIQAIAPFIGRIGMFGEGPSGTLTNDDPLDRRLIDLTGRRP